jgi:HPt (histidine-containing phosphotransfer) domain-containing protein
MMTRFDERRLAELIEIFGPEDLALVVEAFMEETREALATLAEMVGPGPDPVREAQLHYLVGAAHNLGAVAFGDLCKRFQRCDKDFTVEDFAALNAMFRETREAFDDRLRAQLGSAA